MTPENFKQAGMVIALDIAKKRGLINTEENKMTEENETKVTETKTEIINTENLPDVILYAIKSLINKEIAHEAAQVVLNGISLIHLIKNARKIDAQEIIKKKD